MPKIADSIGADATMRHDYGDNIMSDTDKQSISRDATGTARERLHGRIYRRATCQRDSSFRRDNCYTAGDDIRYDSGLMTLCPAKSAMRQGD